jgi:prevent-host-death family protein
MTVTILVSMEPVSKGALKARMLEYLRRVEETGEELIVTDNNRPVVKVVPIRTRHPAKEVFADVRGKVTYAEDLLTPTTEEWSET